MRSPVQRCRAPRRRLLSARPTALPAMAADVDVTSPPLAPRLRRALVSRDDRVDRPTVRTSSYKVSESPRLRRELIADELDENADRRTCPEARAAYGVIPEKEDLKNFG